MILLIAIKMMRRSYEREIQKIGGETIDAAFVPVDPRLGRDFWEGANIFTRRFKVKNFVPMHFCLGEGCAENVRFASLAIDFARYANPEYGCYCALTEPYSVLLLNF